MADHQPVNAQARAHIGAELVGSGTLRRGAYAHSV
jgi:hypothetical protein